MKIYCLTFNLYVTNNLEFTTLETFQFHFYTIFYELRKIRTIKNIIAKTYELLFLKVILRTSNLSTFYILQNFYYLMYFLNDYFERILQKRL